MPERRCHTLRRRFSRAVIADDAATPYAAILSCYYFRHSYYAMPLSLPPDIACFARFDGRAVSADAATDAARSLRRAAAATPPACASMTLYAARHRRFFDVLLLCHAVRARFCAASRHRLAMSMPPPCCCRVDTPPRYFRHAARQTPTD
jgi:hypothetical protein